MTDMIKADGDIIKTDGKGRVRMPAEQREKLLEEFERSGTSGPLVVRNVRMQPTPPPKSPQKTV